MIALAIIILFYLLAALIGSILPANQSWNSPDDGIELFVETNGLHTGIIMPIRTDAHDWSDLIRPEHMTDPALYGSHILVGWGHAGVYRNTRYWRDLRVSDAASAIFGSDETLVHVYHLTYPQAYPHYRRSLKVSEVEYRKIAAAIRARFVLNDAGLPTPSRGYGKDDLFYHARGHYNAFYTCNSWTSDVLRQAGVRTGRWTPFQGGVMRWVPEKAEPTLP
ncbi:TIGR02117 family protein [Parasphingorhabdus halotolerans]|uniref:TIGR02117 family protein n=1 Tax=Parasphingorhabdus halotolerans TaxID=2725558 RepID=A0A6H2DJT9_9SPHN|nr:TIGR02117 family protein [Parasphingorhabdus halotolerans]QJB68604.1 TIGR02117 family protein [Parasphingorhabdus halotolerans]